MEITMYGGYFSNDPMVLVSLIKSTFLSAGIDPFRDVDNDEWAIDAATQTIQVLLEIEKTKFAPKEHVVTLEEADHPSDAGVFSQEDESCSSKNDIVAEEDESEVAIDSETVSLNIEGSLGLVERKRDFVDKNTRTELENTEYEQETDDAEHDGILSAASPGDETVDESGTNVEMQETEDFVRKAS